MALKVECGTGLRGAPEPLAVWFGARRVGVRAIVDRWYAPTRRWFRVDADDGQLYVLRHDEATGEWDLAALTRREPSAGCEGTPAAMAARTSRPS
jgi:hypothetical protein